jgi:hypothetical protein
MKMTKIAALTIATAAVGMISANADPLLDGNVIVNGTFTLNSGSVATATAVEGWSTDGAHGSADFSGITTAGSSFIATPWLFTSTSSTTPLWSDNGVSFYLTGVSIQHGIGAQNNEPFLDINGTGFFAEAGHADTSGTFTIDTQDPELVKGDATGLFSLAAAGGTTGVPDGGTTVALLGSALIGLGGLRRMFRN